MVLQRDSNGNALFEWFCNARFEWFGNAIRMVLQRAIRMVFIDRNTKFKVQSFDVSGSADWVKYQERKEPGDSKHRKEVNIVTLS